MSESRKYIAVAGNIGAGKSSLVRFLCSQFDLQPFYEPNEHNPYLKDFYQDMPRWAFHSQLYFLAGKFRIHQQLEHARSRKTVIQDRSIYEDAEIFAYNLYRCRKMSKRDYQTYQALYETIIGSLHPPDLMIYLRASVRTIKGRIRVRGRPEEQSVPDTYLRQLHRLYENWFEQYDLSPTLVMETDNLDYVTDWVDRVGLLQRIAPYV